MDEALATLVRRQAGAVSRRQLLEHVSERTLRRWLAARVLSRVLPGVYAVATSAVSTSTRLHAALLYAGANAHLSHATAAQVHGIDADAGNSLHVCVPAGRTVQPQPGISIHRSARLFGAQVHETRSRLRVTSVARTLIDLIDTTPRPALDLAVSDALRQKKVTIDYLRKQLVLSGRRRHGRELWVMLDELDPALESALEAEFAALLASAGLPAPTPQHEIWDGPLLVARVDFAYVDRKLALEVDGYEFHSRFDTFQRDRSRRRALIQRKWGVVEFTARDIRTNAGETVQSVQRLLATAA